MISCSPRLTYFNKEMVKEYQWSEEDLKKIQFYLSEDLVLSRRLNTGESTIQSGKIKIVNGEKIEQVIIKKGTPGLLQFMPKEERYAISFDNSSPDKYLIFGTNPKMNSRIVLMGKEWDRRSGKVTYNNSVYDISANAAFSSLLVNLKRAKKVEENTEYAKGNKL